MAQTRNPAGEGGASDGSVHAAKLNTSDHTRPTEPHQVVRDCLMGSGASLAAGLTVTGHAPVLELCRRLVAVGHHPTTPMHVYRDATLALTVRSIGEATRLEINRKGTGFKRLAAVRIDDARNHWRRS